MRGEGEVVLEEEEKEQTMYCLQTDLRPSGKIGLEREGGAAGGICLTCIISSILIDGYLVYFSPRR